MDTHKLTTVLFIISAAAAGVIWIIGAWYVFWRTVFWFSGKSWITRKQMEEGLVQRKKDNASYEQRCDILHKEIDRLKRLNKIPLISEEGLLKKFLEANVEKVKFGGLVVEPNGNITCVGWDPCTEGSESRDIVIFKVDSMLNMLTRKRYTMPSKEKSL